MLFALALAGLEFDFFASVWPPMSPKFGHEHGRWESEMQFSKNNPDWRSLESSISGRVILPESDSYEWAHRSFIARFDDIKPRAVVRCSAPEDVAEVVRFARQYGFETAVRGGGHSYAGYSSTKGILIELAALNSVLLKDGIAKVGAGTRLAQLNRSLLEQNQAIPSGTCPSVGIGGLTLGGGLGILGRNSFRRASALVNILSL